jgi:nonsense-mediated mRNA decay protein 3
VPICKDDLVVLPIALAKKAGNIAPLTLCTRIGTSVQLLDPQTLKTADIEQKMYWRTPFRPLADVQELTEFIVLDIEPLGSTKGRHFLAEATIARASDMGSNDQTYYCRTHLGGILHVGDSAMGYLLANTNFNSELFDVLEQSSKHSAKIPDVVLVKKFYQRSKKNKNKRNWRLKRMGKEEGEMLPRKQDQEKMERDFEMFLQDVEEDEELRAGMALYRAQQEQKQRDLDAMETESSVGEDDEGLAIPMDQLLDDFEDMTMKE